MIEIKNDNELHAALLRLDLIFDAKEGTKESEEANKLADLIEAYEDKNHPLE